MGTSTGSQLRRGAARSGAGGVIPEREVGLDTAAMTPVTGGTGESTLLQGVQPPPADGWMLGGRYRVTARIGSGGMAEVLRGHDIVLGRDVALKVFRSAVDTPDTDGGTERRENELRALARLNHPNLITLFDASMTESPAYLVMELVDGPTLADRLGAGPLPEAEVRVIGAQIADALSYVHSQGMVHRDVKPANILLGSDGWADADSSAGAYGSAGSDHSDGRRGLGRARLSDFGIVRLLGSERLTSADFTLGTASYLAPEQARGGDVQPSADIYALGLVLVEALTGLRSFDGPPMEAVLARLSRPPHIPADLPAPWPQLLTEMTAMDPLQRPSAARVVGILRGDPVSGAYPVAVPATAPAAAEADAPTSALGAVVIGAGDTPRRRRRVGLALVSFLLLAFVAGAAALAFTVGRGSPPADGGQPTKARVSTPAIVHGSSQVAVVGPTQPVTSATRPRPSSAAARTTATHSAPARRSAAPPPVPPVSSNPVPTTTPTPPPTGTGTGAPSTSSADVSSGAEVAGPPATATAP